MATHRHRHSPPRRSGINHLALALALLFRWAQKIATHSCVNDSFGTSRCSVECRLSALVSTRMSYRIERSTNARGVTFLVSGDMDGSQVADLEALMAAESDRRIFLDLADVTLVNRDAITFLAGVEAAGAVLVNCPEYVRSWIDAEQGGA